MPFSYHKPKKRSVSGTSSQSSPSISVLKSPPSISVLRSPPSSHPDHSLRRGNEVDLYTLTATPNPDRNSIYNSIYSSIYPKTNDRTRHQHRNGNHLTSSTRKHDLSTSSATSSAHRMTSTMSNRNKQPADLYTPTHSLYQGGDPDNSIKTYLKPTPPTSTSTSTTTSYIRTFKKNNHLNRTTTAPASIHRQEEFGESIESYIERMEHKDHPRQPEHSTISYNQPTHRRPSSTWARPSPLDTWNDLEIPEMTTATTKATFGENRTAASIFGSGDTISLLSDDEGQLQDANSHQRYTQSLENEGMMNHLTNAASTTSIHESDGISIQGQPPKRRKMDDSSSVVSDPPLALEPHELFRKKRYKSEPKPIPRTKTRRNYKIKDNSRTYKTTPNGLASNGLVKMLAAITLDLGQEKTGLDEKQELAFFDDETPKDNGQKSKSKLKQSLVNGFDGFSDVDDDDDGE